MLATAAERVHTKKILYDIGYYYHYYHLLVVMIAAMIVAFGLWLLIGARVSVWPVLGRIITLRLDAVAGVDRPGHDAITHVDPDRHVSDAGDAV